MNQGNSLSPASKRQVQVAASTGLASFTDPAGNSYSSVQVRLHASGTLDYTNSADERITLTEMPAGVEPIEAKAILVGTNVKVTVYY